jgi:hypothetical protein
MNTILIWMLINTASGSMRTPMQFGSQVDCLRASNQYHMSEPYYHPYRCVPYHIVDSPSGYPLMPVYNIQSKVLQRANRNYSYEQDMINRIISNPPQPVQ